jgi:hypothetical protein
MKCPICNAENATDSVTCGQCGFGLTLSQPSWPEPISVDAVEPPSVDAVEPPTVDSVQVPNIDALGPSKVEAVQAPDVPRPPHQLQPEAGAEAGIRWPHEVIPPSTLGTEVESAPRALPSPSDDELALHHIERAWEAARAGLLDQARWELEQARQLAESSDVVRKARSGLAELARLVEERSIGGSERGQEAAGEPTPVVGRSAPAITGSALRLAMMLGLVNGVLTGVGAAICLGLIVSPLIGFFAGRSLIRRAERSGGEPSLLDAAVVGGGVGLGAWLGELIGHPAWIALSADAPVDPTSSIFSSCSLGLFYLLLTAFASILGGLSARRGVR